MISSRRILHFFEPIFLIAIALVVWQIASIQKVVDPTFFPPPSIIAAEFAKLATTGQMINDLRVSLYQMFAGLVIGASVGILVGVLIGWFKPLYRMLDPLISATYPIPKIAILPLMLVLFGIGNLPIIVIIAIESFYAVVFNTVEGVHSVDNILIRMSRNLGGNTRQILRKVVLPSILPFIFVGVRISLGVALIVDIASQFVIGNAGIGFRLWLSWQIFDIKQMYSMLVVVALLGLLFTYPLLYGEKRLMPWRKQPVT